MKNKTKIRSGNKVTKSKKTTQRVFIGDFFIDVKPSTISKEDFQNHINALIQIEYEQLKELYDEFDQILLNNKEGTAI